MTYFIGEAMAKFLPSKGIFRYINPGPCESRDLIAYRKPTSLIQTLADYPTGNIKEHGFTLIMCSTAAGSAIAVSAPAREGLDRIGANIGHRRSTQIQVISVQDLF